MPFTVIPGGGDLPPTQLLAGVVAVVPTLAGLEVLLVAGKVPAAQSPPDETTARTACRVFEALTGVRARASPLESGFVDMSPSVFYDPPSARPVTAMMYCARIPARTALARPDAAWTPLARVEDRALADFVAGVAARS
jgi:hypothetical protein